MLDDFIEEQSIAYQILKKSLTNNTLSHAYLFETNHYHKGFDMAFSFAKYLLCPSNHTSVEEAKNCIQCQAMDHNSFSELKVIDSDGLWIKKEQLDSLQKDFSKKAVEGTKKVYIINHAERLNTQAANSILKFLEEPEPDIVAILVTENQYLLLNTIVSRCQVIKLKPNKFLTDNMSKIEKIANHLFNNSSDIQNFIENNKSQELVDKVLEFVSYYEKNGLETIIFTEKLWHSIITDKEDIYNALTIMILYYKDILNVKLENSISFFDINENFNFIEKNNTIKEICDKINIILKQRDKIKYNVNNMLLIDKLIMELEEVHD